MFEDAFAKLHERNKEIKLMGVWGKDGLELERKRFAAPMDLDLELTGAELADIITKMQNMRPAPDKYFIKLNYRSYYLVIFSLTPDFFLMAVTDKDIISGRLLFYFNLFKHQMMESL